MKIVSALQIRKSFKIHYGIEYSLEAIHVMSKRLGFKRMSSGMKKGYSQNLYTELQRHWKELNEVDAQIKQRKSNKVIYGQDYNPDRYIEPEGRSDYVWENRMLKEKL